MDKIDKKNIDDLKEIINNYSISCFWKEKFNEFYTDKRLKRKYFSIYSDKELKYIRYKSKDLELKIYK